MRKRLRLGKRYNPEFEKFFKEHCTLDEETGKITVRDAYAHLGFNIGWRGDLVSVTYANAVWFLKHGEWPKHKHHIDHINDDSLDNRPCNLQELTEAANQAKRRGRKVYRSYGSGKYGYGIGVHNDKRDGRFYVDRTLSRGHGKGDLKGIRYSLGGFDTLDEAEQAVAAHISVLEINGPDHIPVALTKKPKKTTVEYDKNTEEMRELRRQGMTFQQIADKFGVRLGVVYRRTRDVS
jgi:hypothetical protein